MIRSIIKHSFSNIKAALFERIKQTINPEYLEIQDESKFHKRGEQTHFKMLIVSKKFENLTKLQQQRLVYQSLGQYFPQIHALTLKCQTSKQRQKNKEPFKSPSCVNGKTKIN